MGCLVCIIPNYRATEGLYYDPSLPFSLQDKFWESGEKAPHVVIGPPLAVSEEWLLLVTDLLNKMMHSTTNPPHVNVISLHVDGSSRGLYLIAKMIQKCKELNLRLEKRRNKDTEIDIFVHLQ